jgi:polysaccharide pyruvyl transferase WcaK-like protein
MDHIYVRDKSSLNRLIEYGYTNVTYIPDISVVLKGDIDNGRELIDNIFREEKRDKYQKVYSIVVNSHLMGNSNTSTKSKNMFNKMVDDITEVIDKTSASFLFIPFSTDLPWDDRVTNGIVNSNCKFYKKNCVIYDKLSVKDSIDILSASDKIITTRYHGLIFGVGNNVPTCMISFHDKMSKFCEDYDKSYINYWSFSVENFMNELNSVKSLNIDTNKIKEEYREKVYLLRG